MEGRGTLLVTFPHLAQCLAQSAVEQTGREQTGGPLQGEGKTDRQTVKHEAGEEEQEEEEEESGESPVRVAGFWQAQTGASVPLELPAPVRATPPALRLDHGPTSPSQGAQL